MKERLQKARSEAWDDARLASEAVLLAEEVLNRALERRRLGERYADWKLSRMLATAGGKEFTMALVDQVFRPRSASRSASLLARLVERVGLPRSLPWYERMALQLAAEFGPVLPDLVVPMLRAAVRRETRAVVLPGEEEALARHVALRRTQGARLNLNMLGEAVLGEEEAGRRLAENVRRLEGPDCDYLSVKISSIFSQVNVLAHQHTLERLKGPLRTLYRTAMAGSGTDGRAKFVSLDMEEYRDLHLTVDLFREVLEEEEFRRLEAGIVLQAYLPDSFLLQRDLTEWARQRVADGGAGIKIRLVKGANLAMERVDAAVHGWAQAPYRTKAEVDANFKRMLHYACRSENAGAVRLGVGSHNLFDVGYALLLRSREGVEERVEMEMLEGMASHQAREVEDLAEGMLYYAPVVKEEDFTPAIAYLVRRLDENTTPGNFLRDLFGMVPGGPRWRDQRERFLGACRSREEVSSRPARQQNREIDFPVLDLQGAFENAPDTDWTRAENRAWVRRALDAEWGREPMILPLQIAGRFRSRGPVLEGVDPGDPDWSGDRQVLASAVQVEEALAAAERAWRVWGASIDERRKLLKMAACGIGRNRGALIAAMLRDGGKTVPEADAEVSEAVDFANYYADSLSWPGLEDGVRPTGLGVVVVAPPWNFPLAIACGGVLAGLMAGNAVILKPSPEACLSAWRLAETLWDAGVPRELLQLVAVPEDEVGKALLTDARVAAVILTGSCDTADLFLGWNPSMRLLAETSGKNAMVITAAADLDQAVKDLVRSAFGHAGQKCSAASLAIVEAEVYDDPTFRRQLRDAAGSLPVGTAWDLANAVPPLINPPGEMLARGLRDLDEGEEWLLEPRSDPDNPRIWSPGIRLGVRPDSWFFRAECFGPVLGVMRAADFADALRMQNMSRFGLTGGLHSLDVREIALWRESVEVGNAYVNRPITGAIVRRQPFGGWKRSAVGAGAKAGGPNYVLQLARWEEDELPELQADLPEGVEHLVGRLVGLLPRAAERLRAAAGSYRHWWQAEFASEHDPSQILGESNVFRYRPLERVVLRDGAEDPAAAALVILAAATCGMRLRWSMGREDRHAMRLADLADVPMMVEPEDAFVRSVEEGSGELDLIRTFRATDALRLGAHHAGTRLATEPVLANGRLELRHYLREQSVCETTHRYGNVSSSTRG